MSFQMQLAVQGGGAKICALLAVLEVIQKFESESRLKVTRVAGTSAGSIIASFLAARVEAASIRSRLLMPGVNDRLVRLFPRPGLRRALLLLLRGSPLWKERPLRDILRKEFRAAGLQDLTLGALK